MPSLPSYDTGLVNMFFSKCSALCSLNRKWKWCNRTWCNRTSRHWDIEIVCLQISPRLITEVLLPSADGTGCVGRYRPIPCQCLSSHFIIYYSLQQIASIWTHSLSMGGMKLFRGSRGMWCNPHITQHWLPFVKRRLLRAGVLVMTGRSDRGQSLRVLDYNGVVGQLGQEMGAWPESLSPVSHFILVHNSLGTAERGVSTRRGQHGTLRKKKLCEWEIFVRLTIMTHMDEQGRHDSY